MGKWSFFYLDGLALDNVILNIVFVITGLAHALVDGLTLLGSLSLADEWGVTELDLLIEGDLLVFDETVLDEVLLALFLLLGLEVGGVGGVTPLAVAVLALNDVIVFGLLNHDDLVDTTLTGGGDGSDVESNLGLLGTLTGITGWWGDGLGSCGCVGMGVIVLVSVIMSVFVSGSSSGASIEWEGVGQTLLIAATLTLNGSHGDQANQDG